jgi:hypothetical protein
LKQIINLFYESNSTNFELIVIVQSFGLWEELEYEAYQVAAEDDLGPVAYEVLDGGDGGAEAGVVGNVVAVVEGHVEVGA